MTNLKDANWATTGEGRMWHQHSKLAIGKYCSIAANVHFICDSRCHVESEITTFPLFSEVMPKEHPVRISGQTYNTSEIKDKVRPSKCGITIGNDTWIGMNAMILPGVIIGNGVTILPGSVVSKNIPDYSICGDVPAKITKMKHDDDSIAKFNKFAWWNWPVGKIRENIDDFYLPAADFLNKHS
jgi:virginiamycin A acetyltransferase